MKLYRNKKISGAFSRAAAVSAAFVLFSFLQGCFLISLEKIDLLTYPAERHQIIGIGEELWVEFSIPPVEEKSEKLFTLRGENKSIEGDFHFSEGRLYFKPVPDLQPGVRYSFSYEGSLEAADGRNFDVSLIIPFFAGSAEIPAVLKEAKPSSGGEIDLAGPVRFSFSRSLQGGTLEEGLDVRPHCEYEVIWNNDGTTASVLPRIGWEPHTVYTWTIDESVTDMAGIPLQAAYTGTFIAGNDGTVPALLSMGPAGLIGNTYLDQPGYGRDDAVRFVFSTAMDFESLQNAFEITPPLIGTFHEIDAETVIFDPEEQLLMNTEYFIVIGPECKSRLGNFISSPIHLSFLTDIPLQKVEHIELIGSTPVLLLPPDFGNAAVPVLSFSGAGLSYSAGITITFAEPYEEPFRSAITENISLTAYFPATVSNPAIISKTWSPGNDMLTLTYSGFIKSEAVPSPEQVLYRLTVPGGAALSINQNGSFLEDEVWIIFQSERQS